MRRIVGALAAAAVSAGCASAAAVPDRSDVLRRILPSTVQLRSERDDGGRRSGSGVVVGSDPQSARSWILTTRHFLEPARRQRLSVTSPGSRQRLPAEVTAMSDEVDLALIEVKGAALPPVTLKDLSRLGDEVWVVAFPWGRRLTVVSGIVSQLVADDVEVTVEGAARMIDASVSYGTSGGGVFEATTGNLIAIVESYRTARVTVQTTPERVVDIPVPGETTVVSAATIRRFLHGTGVDSLLAR